MMHMWEKGEYGHYAYYVAMATILLAIAEFGTPNVFRKSFNNVENYNNKQVYSSIYAIRFVFLLVVSFIFIFLAFYYSSAFFIFYSFTTLIISFRLNEYKLEMTSENGFISKIKSLVYLVGLILKVSFVCLGFKLEVIAFITLLEHCAFSIAFYYKAGFDFRYKDVNSKLVKCFIGASVAFAVTYLITLLGGKVYTLLVFNVLGSEDTAVFAFSTRMLEIILVPTQVFPVVLIPLLIKSAFERDVTYEHFSRLFSYSYLFVTLMSIAIIPLVLPYLIDDYEEVVDFLMVYFLTLLFFLWNSLSSVFYISHGLNKILVYRAFSLLVVNTIVGVFLMSFLGLVGIVYAIIFSFIFVDLSSAIVSKVCRAELTTRIKGLSSPWNIPYSIVFLTKSFDRERNQ